MWKSVVLAVLIVTGLNVVCALAQDDRFGGDRDEAQKHGWVFNYEDARREARRSNRPLMVVLRCVP